MIDHLLVTGFGPFEDVDANPSAHLAQNCGRKHSIIEVSYGAAKEFVQSLDPSTFSCLLLIGLHGKCDDIQLEMVARNQLEHRADVSGHVPDRQRIRDGAPDEMRGTLWSTIDLAAFVMDHRAQISSDAGGYLCNYIYYEALTAFPDKRIGFLHVPTEKAMSLEDQQAAVHRLIELIEGSSVKQ